MNRDDFLAARRSGIGGSDVAALLGLSSYKSPVELWMEKTGRVADDADSLPLRFGRYAEDFVAREWSARTGRSVQRFTRTLRHPDYPVAIGHVDRLVIPGGAKRAAHQSEIRTDTILECKTASAFKRAEWGEEGTDQVPQEYLVQVEYYLALSGCEYGALAVLLGNAEVRCYQIRRDRELEKFLLRKASEWWQRHVVDGVAPEPRSEGDIALLYPQSAARIVQADEAVLADVQALRAVREQMAGLEADCERLRVSIKGVMGDADVLADGDKVLATWRTSKPTKRIDHEALRKGYPDVVAAVTRECAGSRPFLLK